MTSEEQDRRAQWKKEEDERRARWLAKDRARREEKELAWRRENQPGQRFFAILFLVLLLGVTVAGLGGGGYFAWLTWSTHRDADRFNSAAACTAAATGACRQQLTLRVLDVSTYINRTQTRRCVNLCSTHSYTRITAQPVAGGPTYHTELDGDRRSAAAAGDRIRGTVWNGSLMIVRLRTGQTLNTGDNPNGLATNDAGLAAACLGAGLFALLLTLLMFRFLVKAIRPASEAAD